MSFKEYSFKDIIYDDDNDSCSVTLEIVDDKLGSVENTFIIGSKHFKGKALSTPARNKIIKKIAKQEAKVIHERMVTKAELKAVAPSNTKIPAFAKGTSLI